MKQPQNGLWHAGVAAMTYLSAFFVAFAPYAFVDGSAESVANTFGGIGGWAVIAAVIISIIALGVNVMGVVRAIGGIRADIDRAPLGLVLNALPGALTAYMVIGLLP